MQLSKISNVLILSFGVTLAGCGGGGGTDTPTNPPPQSPTKKPLSVVNPISNMQAKIGDDFDFIIPSNTCTATSGVAIGYQITSLKNGSGLSLINMNQLKGVLNKPGTVEATITCKTSSESKTDSFVINISDVNLAPEVTTTGPSTAKDGEKVSLVADAKDNNATGSITSYLWTQTSGPTQRSHYQIMTKQRHHSPLPRQAHSLI